jgi:hypothetical protein
MKYLLKALEEMGHPRPTWFDDLYKAVERAIELEDKETEDLEKYFSKILEDVGI